MTTRSEPTSEALNLHAKRLAHPRAFGAPGCVCDLDSATPPDTDPTYRAFDGCCDKRLGNGCTCPCHVSPDTDPSGLGDVPNLPSYDYDPRMGRPHRWFGVEHVGHPGEVCMSPDQRAYESIDRNRVTDVEDLLNSLGIAGPNIRHALATEPDPKLDPDVQALTADDDWCVCGRIWPCEALQLVAAIHESRAGGGLDVDVERLRRASDAVSEMDPLDYLDDGDEWDAIAAAYAKDTGL